MFKVKFFVKNKKDYEFVPGLLYLSCVKSIYPDCYCPQAGDEIKLLKINHTDGTYCHIEYMPLSLFC